jgi:hypothetical protein
LREAILYTQITCSIHIFRERLPPHHAKQPRDLLRLMADEFLHLVPHGTRNRGLLVRIGSIDGMKQPGVAERWTRAPSFQELSSSEQMSQQAVLRVLHLSNVGLAQELDTSLHLVIHGNIALPG